MNGECDSTVLADVDTGQHAAIMEDIVYWHPKLPTLVMLAHPCSCKVCGYRCEKEAQLEERRKVCGCYIKDCVIDGPYGLNKDTGEIEKVKTDERTT